MIITNNDNKMTSSIDISLLINSTEEQDFKNIYVIDDEVDMAHFSGKFKKYLNISHIFYINNDLLWDETNYNTVSKVMIKNAIIFIIDKVANNKNISMTLVFPTSHEMFNKIIINIHHSYITVCRYKC